MSLRRIRPDEAKLGMFIHGFEGSWFSHPFWRRRFMLTEPDDLAKLIQSDVAVVVIDISKGRNPDETAAAAVNDRAAAAAPGTSGRERRAPARDNPEVERATRIVRESKRVMKGVFEQARLGKAVRVADVISVVDEISQSVQRDASTLIRITRLKSKDEYTYLHSVAVCALMVNLGRDLGMKGAELRDLGIAGLLHDIGKMGIPAPVLNKPERLSEDEFALVRNHPEHGARLLAADKNVPPVAIEVCRHHHEKIDGTGYPARLAADDIGLPARMGAICDVYDALTSNRVYKDAWTPAQAITEMWSWEGHFDRRLLFRFMQSIAVFPVGMLVRLRSNRLGIVLDNGRRASRPRVRAFYDTGEKARIAPRDIVISDSLADDQIVSAEHPYSWGFEDWKMLWQEVIGA